MTIHHSAAFTGRCRLLAAALLLAGGGALAGNHQYSKFEYDAADDTGYFDLVVSLDWNPDQAARDGILKAAFEAFAETVWDASEGKHKLRKVRVYLDGQEKKSADIYIRNAAGRANANVNGFGAAGGRINMFMKTSGGGTRTGQQVGLTLAHEMGHYAYGLYDEYKEAGTENDDIPYMPHSDDVPADGIMNSQYTFQNYSVADGYPTKTAQFRIHAAACWPTLVRDVNDDPREARNVSSWQRRKYEGLVAPAGKPSTQSGGKDVLDVVYMEGSAAQIVLVIDRSGSMSGWKSETGADGIHRDDPLPGGGAEKANTDKMEVAKLAAKQFVDMLQVGDSIAVVDFDDMVTTLVDLREITGPPPRTAEKDAIDTLYARGMTAIGDGLRRALDILSQSSASDARRAVVLLTDGMHNSGSEDPSTVVPDYAAAQVPIFSIGLGTGVEEASLQSMAQQTGGLYYFAPTADQLQEIYSHITQQTSSKEEMLSQEEAVLSEGGAHELAVLVDESAENMTFLASWSMGDSMSFTLVSPGGVEITPDNAGGFPEIDYAEETTYALYRVAYPETGPWVARVTAGAVYSGGRVGIGARGVTDISAKLSVPSAVLDYPAPLNLIASLRRNLPIVGAQVSGKVTAPDGTEYAVEMRDDGLGADVLAGDGLYSGSFGAYTEDGQYRVRVAVDNAALQAAETDMGITESGTGGVLVPIGEDFERLAETVVTVQGVTPDDYGNEAGAAKEIQADNTDYPGRIESGGDEDWFSVQIPEDMTRLSFRVSGLGFGMLPRMRLFSEDGSTVVWEGALAEDKLEAGAYLALSAEVSPGEKYYAAVQHVDPDAAGGGYHVSAGKAVASDKRTGDGDMTVSLLPQETATSTLIVRVQGQGSVTPSGTSRQPQGATVTVQAVPAPGWKFVKWDGPVADSGAVTTTVTLSGDATLTAVFSSTQKRGLFSCSAGSGEGGSPVSDGALALLTLCLMALASRRRAAPSAR